MQGGQIKGWDVTTQGDKVKYIFRQELAAQVAYRLTRIEDTHGNAITFTYDGAHRVTQVTDASGVRNIQIGYTADASNKQVAWVRLNYPGGSRQWDFSYSSWHLTQIDYPAPLTGGPRPNVKFTYNLPNTNLTDIYDLRGHRWSYTYALTPYSVLSASGVYPPSLANPTTASDSVGTNFTWSIFTSGPTANWTKTCTINDRRGWNWRHVYYNNGNMGNPWFSNPIKETWDGGLVSNDLYTWNYSDGTVATHTDRRGNAQSFTYDSRGNMLTKTDREGWLWRWIYYQDKVVTQIDPTQNRTIYAYYTPSWDLAHVTVDPKTDPFDGTYNKPTGIALKTNYNYNAAGELTSQWTGTDTPVQYSNFDAYGNARTVTDPNGHNTTFTFDHLNNKLTETRPSPQGTTNYAYDNWNRPTRVTHPGGSYAETTYDNNGNKLTVRDENAFVTTFYYNAWNWNGGFRQPVDATPANDIIVEYFYDADGHRIQIVNGRGKSTYYDTDSRGKVWRIRYPDSTNRQFTFDGNGNVLTRTDGKGQVTTFVYDKEDRLTQRKYGSTVDFTNTWRSDGLLSQRVDPTGTYTWGYDGAKQLTSNFQPVPNKTVTYTYDTGGRRKTMAVGSMTWTYNFGSDTRLTNIQQTVGASTAVAQTYNPDGSLLTRTFGANAQILRPTYDTRGRTTVLSYRSISGGTETERQRVEYSYDDVGNILTYRNNGSGGGGNNWLTNYTYDRANRLKTEIRTGGGAHNFNLAYNYDKSNNRTSVVRNGSSSSYTVDDNDKFLTGDGFTASSYDNDGNPGTLNWPGRGNYNFTYDKEQKPTTIVAAGLGTWTHTYNGAGQRVKLVSPSGERRYVFDGSTVIAETNFGGTILTYHIPDVGWIDGSTQRFYRQNGLGSNLSILDTAGTKVSESEFDGYGNEYVVNAGPKNQFGFAGKHGYQTDANDLQLLGARFYVAPLGRFLTQDPIGQAGGLNLYSYCVNNPVGAVDPDGKEELWIIKRSNTAIGAHTILGLRDSRGNMTYYGFYPNEDTAESGRGSSGKGATGRAAKGYVKLGDYPEKGSEAERFTISYDQYRTLKAGILQNASYRYQGKGKAYNLKNYNCTDWAAKHISDLLGYDSSGTQLENGAGNPLYPEYRTKQASTPSDFFRWAPSNYPHHLGHFKY